MAKKHKYDYFDAYEELSDLAVQEASVLVRAMELHRCRCPARGAR